MLKLIKCIWKLGNLKKLIHQTLVVKFNDFPLFYCIGIYKVQTCIWKVIGISFVINQPLIEKFNPYNMPLLPNKNVFFS